MEWISIKDRLPEEVKLVLVSNNESKHKEDHWVCCGQINYSGGWFNQFQDSISDIQIYPTHWMPLPEPPKTN